MDLLLLLVERRSQLVSRADIVERLWGKDVFVDAETRRPMPIPASIRAAIEELAVSKERRD